MKLNFIKRQNCPVCGSTQAKTIYSEGFAEGKTFDFLAGYYKGRLTRDSLKEGLYQLDLCRGCNLIFQRYILDDSGMECLYDRVIDPDESLSKREGAGEAYFKAILRSASMPYRFFSSKAPRELKVLDFGMGWGHWVVASTALGFTAYGAELSKSRVEFARRIGVKVIDPLNTPAELRFNYINTDQVFEHLGDPILVFRMLSKLITVEGVINISVPNASFIQSRIRAGKWSPGKNALQPLEHINGFNLKSMTTLAGIAGFAPLAVSEVSRNPLDSVIKFIKRGSGAPSWYFRKKR